jgi:heat shock protein HslJ
MVAPDSRSQPVLVIDGAMISGSMGVNRLSGEMTGGFRIGPLATTRMAGPAELMAQEDALLGHLQSADTIEVVEDGMCLSRDGLVLMELRRAGTA